MKTLPVESLGSIDDAIFIDVRSPVEYREVHAEGSRNIPLDSLNAEELIDSASGKPIYMICKSGQRGSKACRMIADAGYEDVINIEGGTDAWVNAGRRTVHSDKSVISLERQVRIAAGFLVFAGTLLTLLVHPWFIALPMFVGAGLVFAGISNFCGMGLLIARMPWNN